MAAAAQVVVDDESTAKELLERGQLTRRVTLIPLNKVRLPQAVPVDRGPVRMRMHAYMEALPMSHECQQRLMPAGTLHACMAAFSTGQ